MSKSAFRNSIAVAAMAAAMLSVEAQAVVRIPVLDAQFDTAGFGGLSPNGIALNTSTGNYAIVDSNSDEVYIVSSAGELLSQFDTAAFGSTSPQGITYIPATDQYAIVDNVADSIYFVASDGTFNTSCNISVVATSPTGIAHNPADSSLAVTNDGSDDEVYIFDSTCALLNQFDTTFFGSTAPSDIAWNNTTGLFAVLDSTLDEVLIVDGTGFLIDRADTANLPAFSPSGITYDPASLRYALSDTSADQVFFIDIRGELINQFDIDTPPFSLTAPSGLTLLPALQQIAVVDTTSDEIVVLDKNENLIRRCSMLGLGSDNPVDIAYLSATDEFAVVDATDDEVYIVDAVMCALNAQFDTSTFGSDAPTGIGFNEATGNLLITDTTDRLIYEVDLKGNFVNQRSLGRGSPAGPGTGTTDISYIYLAGNSAVSDSTADEIFILNSLGGLEMQFDTNNPDVFGVGSKAPTGVEIDEATGEIIIVDNGADKVLYILSIPKILEARTVTGSCFGDIGVPYVLNLVEENGSRTLSGSLLVSGLSLPVSGINYKDFGALGITVFVGVRAFSDLGTISADFNTITLQAFGVCQRP